MGDYQVDGNVVQPQMLMTEGALCERCGGHPGFILNTEDGSVIPMGSRQTLDDWFWAREAGLLSPTAIVEVDLLVDLRTLRAALCANPPGLAAWSRAMQAVRIPARLPENSAWLGRREMRVLSEAGCLRALVREVGRV